MTTPIFSNDSKQPPIVLKKSNPVEAALNSKTKFGAMTYMRPRPSYFEDYNRRRHPHSSSNLPIIIESNRPLYGYWGHHSQMRQCDWIFLGGIVLAAYLSAKMLSKQ
jgi:hypothetical protein